MGRGCTRISADYCQMNRGSPQRGPRITTTATAIEPRMHAETRGSLRGRESSRRRGRRELGAARGSLACQGRTIAGERARASSLEPRAEQLAISPQKTNNNSSPGAPSLASVAIDPRHPRSSAAQLPLPFSAALRVDPRLIQPFSAPIRGSPRKQWGLPASAAPTPRSIRGYHPGWSWNPNSHFFPGRWNGCA